MSKKQSGFTLIEVCVSLFLILLCLVIPIHSMQQAKQEVEAYRFLTEFEKSVKLYHQKAVLTSFPAEIRIDSKQVYFDYRHQETISLTYPKGMSFAVSDPIALKFTQRTGTSQSTSIIRFLLPSGQKVLYTFKLGRGNYDKNIE